MAGFGFCIRKLFLVLELVRLGSLFNIASKKEKIEQDDDWDSVHETKQLIL